MAYNSIDVTAGKGDVINGPLWWFQGGYTEEIDLTFNPAETAGWVQIGEASTDGVDIAQEADKNEKRVWGNKSLGSSYSNFTSTLTVRHASSTDADLLKVMYGKDNVVSDGGTLKITVKSRQPEVGTMIVMGVTDDGRKRWQVVPKAQPDLNLTYSWGDEDIVVIEAVYDCISDAEGVTDYQLIEEAVTPPVDPEA